MNNFIEEDHLLSLLKIGFSYCKIIYKDKEPFDFEIKKENSIFYENFNIEENKRFFESLISRIKSKNLEKFVNFKNKFLSSIKRLIEIKSSYQFFVEFDLFEIKNKYFKITIEYYSTDFFSLYLSDETDTIIQNLSDFRNFKPLSKYDDKKQLTIEKEYLNYVIDATEIGTWKWNIQTGETEYNEQWAKMLGYSLEELAPISEDTWRKLVHPNDLIKSDNLIQRHIKGELPFYSCEVRLKHKNGKYRWIEDKGKILFWTEDGKPLLMFGIHIDITEKKKIEKELIESQNLFQNLADLNLINIALLQNNHFIYANIQFMKTTGYALHELMKMDLIDIIEDQYVSSVIKSLNRSSKKVSGFTAKIKTKNGSSKWIYGFCNKVKINSKDSILFSFNDITQNKKIENELKKSQEQLQNLIDAANVGTWIWNIQTDQTIYNETWAKLLGYTLDELKPVSLQTWKRLTDPEDVKRTYTELEKHWKGETDFYECEIKMKHKNGKWIWILDRGKVITWDKNGKLLLMFGIHADITKLKETEQQLKDKNKFIDMILNTIPVRVFWKDKNFIYLGCNKLFAEDVGLKNPEDIIGKKDDFFNPPDDSELFRKEDKQVIETGKPIFSIEQISKDADGNTMHVRKHKVPLLDENNDIIGVLGTYEDITDLKEKEKLLLEEKEKLNVIIQSISDAIIATDKNEKVILINKIAQTLTGFSETEALDKPLSQIYNIFDENTMQKLENPLKQVNRKNKIFNFGSSILLISKNGEKYIIEDSFAPIKTYENEIIGFVLVFRDVNEKIKLLMEANRASKLESLSSLAAGIAHDFNNLLGGIYGFINLAKNESSFDSAKENLLMALNTLERAKALANQLLTFSKGGKPLLKEELLNDIIHDTTIFALSGSNIEPVFTISSNLLPVLCDKNMISQVIENIVINARQAMKKYGKIFVEAKNIKIDPAENDKMREGDYVAISIRDEGEGIPKENIKNIFDPFFTTKKDGTGLGLSVCYSIIKQHNGFIEVNSEVGKGTEFIIYLPVFKKDKNEILPNLQNDMNLKKEIITNLQNDKILETEKQFYNNKELNDKIKNFLADDYIYKENMSQKDLNMQKIKRILVLDDEFAILKSISKYLTKKGFIVDEAENGEKALELYYKKLNENEKYDLLILDLTVQTGMGGKEVIEKIREKDKEILAIVSSGYFDDPILSDPEKFGFNKAIQKPFILEDLLNLILSLQNKN